MIQVPNPDPGGQEDRETSAHVSMLDVLAASHGTLAQAVDALPLPVLFVDDEEIIRGVNRAALEALQPTDDGVVGRALSDYFDRLPPGGLHEACERLLGPEAGEATPVTLRRKHGAASGRTGDSPVFEAHLTRLEIDGAPLLQLALRAQEDAVKDQQRWNQLAREITRLRHARRQLLDSLPVLVTVQDSHGRIVDINQLALDRLAMAREDMLGRHFTEFFPHADDTSCETGSAGQHNARSREVEAGNLGGHFLLISRPLISPDGAPVGAINVAVDITEKRRMESQLLQAQKMESVGALASGISHDFNNLLTGIMGGTTALRHMVDTDKPEVENYLTLIEHSAARGADLARRLLSFSRINPGETEPVDLGQLIEETVRLLRGAIEPRIELQPLTGAVKGAVMANPTMLQQVLMNLAINARDAINGHGAIRFRLSQTPVDKLSLSLRVPCDSGQAVVMEIEDTGGGIPPEVLPRIFEPFFTTKAADRGTGLGLAMVYSIVKQFNGVIDVQSALGKGTTFRMVFPLSNVAPALPVVDESPLPRGNETILIVDDESVVCELAATILQEFGYQVFTAIDGPDALALYQERGERIQLVIFDLLMPRMGGEALYLELKRCNPYVRGILSSGCLPVDGGGDLLSGLPMVQKPYRVADLVRMVRTVLDAPPPERPAVLPAASEQDHA